jgi:hypothetical protein
MNTLIFIPTDVKSRRLGGATQPLGLRWGFETTSIRFSILSGQISIRPYKKAS